MILVHGFAVSLLTLDRNQSVFSVAMRNVNHVIRHVAQNNNGDLAANGLFAVFFLASAAFNPSFQMNQSI